MVALFGLPNRLPYTKLRRLPSALNVMPWNGLELAVDVTLVLVVEPKACTLVIKPP